MNDAAREKSATSSHPLEEIDHLLTALSELLSTSNWAEGLCFHAVDLLDAARSPLFVDLLAAARTPASHAPAPIDRAHWTDRVRRYAIDRQLPRPLLEWKARRRSDRPRNGDILFWPREPTHVSVQRPVLKALRTLAPETPGSYVVCQPRLFHALAEEGQSITLTRAEWPDLVGQVRECTAPLLDRLSEPISPRLEPGPGDHLSGTRIEEVVRRTLTRQIPTIVETILATESMVEELAPRAIVVGNDLTLEGRAAALTARRLGTPTLALMHGTVTSDPLQRHHVVDRFLVYGDRSRAELVASGVTADGIAVTGNPQLASRPKPSPETDPRVLQFGQIEAGAPWVLVASSGPGHRTSSSHHEQFIRALQTVAEELPEIRFVVKLHRKDRRENYPADPPFAIVEHGQEGAPRGIFSWLRGPSALITGASTVAIEAMLMTVPVITVDLAGELADVDFISAGATHHANGHREILQHLAGILASSETAGTNERVESFLQETFAHLDDEPARRAAEVLLQVAQENANGAQS